MNQVITTKNENIMMPNTVFTITNQKQPDQQFHIYYLENKNLYLETKNDKIPFIIGEGDVFLYQCFDHLFETLDKQNTSILFLFSSEPDRLQPTKKDSLKIIKEKTHFTLIFDKGIPNKRKDCVLCLSATTKEKKDLLRSFSYFYQELGCFEENYQFKFDDYSKVKQYRKS